MFDILCFCPLLPAVSFSASRFSGTLIVTRSTSYITKQISDHIMGEIIVNSSSSDQCEYVGINQVDKVKTLVLNL